MYKIIWWCNHSRPARCTNYRAILSSIATVRGLLSYYYASAGCRSVLTQQVCLITYYYYTTVELKRPRQFLNDYCTRAPIRCSFTSSDLKKIWLSEEVKMPQKSYYYSVWSIHIIYYEIFHKTRETLTVFFLIQILLMIIDQ